jgi:hypothetical protein
MAKKSEEYKKYVIQEPIVMPSEFVTYHQKGSGPYLEYLNNILLPETKMYMSVWKIEKMPEGNPPCKIHAHKVDQAVLYIGEPETFEILYHLVPPGAKLDNEWWAPDYQYVINRTGVFYIPAGVRHNNYILRLDKPPVYEVTIMLQAAYDKQTS